MDKLAELTSRVLCAAQDLSLQINPEPDSPRLTKQVDALVCDALITALQYVVKHSFEESIKIAEGRLW